MVFHMEPISTSDAPLHICILMIIYFALLKKWKNITSLCIDLVHVGPEEVESWFLQMSCSCMQTRILFLNCSINWVTGSDKTTCTNPLDLLLPKLSLTQMLIRLQTHKTPPKQFCCWKMGNCKLIDRSGSARGSWVIYSYRKSPH